MSKTYRKEEKAARVRQFKERRKVREVKVYGVPSSMAQASERV